MGKIDCEIIMDLLPNYVEELTSGRTDQVVKEHLESCEDCRKAYEQMIEELHPSREEKIPESPKILFFLKKMKSRAFLKGVLITAVICLSLWGITEAYRYVKCAVAVPAKAVSAKSYLLEDGSIYVDIQVDEEYPVTHGWSWQDENSPFTVSAWMDQIPLDWLYWIENHLPLIGSEEDTNQRAILIPADEAADTEIIFVGGGGEEMVVLYDADTELLPGTERLERAVKEGTVYHHMVMNDRNLKQ